jgi:hypothetical protein
MMTSSIWFGLAGAWLSKPAPGRSVLAPAAGALAGSLAGLVLCTIIDILICFDCSSPFS